jgi:predicted MFS family arabinose efflux permease
VLGAVLVTSALMLGVYTIVKASDYGWGSLHSLGLGAASLALLAVFVLRQARAANPLMPLRVFRSRNVSGANLVQVVVVAGMFGMFFLGTLYLERVLGFDPLEIGFAFLPATIVMGIFSAGLSARLNTRFGARVTLIPALVALLIGLVLFAMAPVDGSYAPHVLPAVILIGVGAGLAFPSLMMLAMAGVPQEDAGLASGLVNTTAQVGGALGLAVLATLASGRSEDLLASGESTASALTSGYHLAFVVGAGLIALGIGIALTLLRPERVAAEAAAAEHGATSAHPAYAESS